MLTLRICVNISQKTRKAVSVPTIPLRTPLRLDFKPRSTTKSKSLVNHLVSQDQGRTLRFIDTKIQRRFCSSLTTTSSYELTPAENVVNKALSLWTDSQSESAFKLLQDFMDHTLDPSLPPHFHILQNSSVLITHGMILMSQGHFEEATNKYRILVDASRLQLDKWSHSLQDSRGLLQQHEESSNEWIKQKEREAMLIELLADLKTTLGSVYHDMGRAQEIMGLRLESQESYTRSIEILEGMGSHDNALIGTVRASMSMLYENVGNYRVAEPSHEQSLRSSVAIERYDHPHLATMLHPAHMISSMVKERSKMQETLDQIQPEWRTLSTQVTDLSDTRTPEQKMRAKTEAMFKAKVNKSLPAGHQVELSDDAKLELPPPASDTPPANTVASFAQDPITHLKSLIPASIASAFMKPVPEEQRVVLDSMRGPDGQLTPFDIIQTHTKQEVATLQHIRKAYTAKLGNSHMALVPIYSHLAVLSRRIGDFPSSLEFLQLALAVVQQLKGDCHCTYATALMHLSVHYHAQQEMAQAEIYAKQALRLKQELLGADHLHVGLIHYDLAIILGKRSLFKESVQSLSSALSIFEKKLYLDHPFTIQAKQAMLQAEDLIIDQSIEDSQQAVKGFIEPKDQ